MKVKMMRSDGPTSLVHAITTTTSFAKVFDFGQQNTYLRFSVLKPHQYCLNFKAFLDESNTFSFSYLALLKLDSSLMIEMS